MRKTWAHLGMACLALGMSGSLAKEAKADAVAVLYCFHATCQNPGNVVQARIHEVLAPQSLVIEVTAVHVLDAGRYVVPEVGQRYTIEVTPSAYEANAPLVLLSPPLQLVDEHGQAISPAWRTFKAPAPNTVACWDNPNYAVLVDDFVEELQSEDCHYLNLPILGPSAEPDESSGCQGGASPVGLMGLGLALGMLWQRRRIPI